MNWNRALMDALKNGNLSEVAAQARNRYQPVNPPAFDYKSRQAGEREPGEDEREAA